MNSSNKLFPLRRTAKAILTFSALILFATGCGLIPQSESAPDAPIQPAEEAAPVEPPPALPPADDARQVVENFLTALQLDAGSPIAGQLLTDNLIQKAAGGESLQAGLLKTAEVIPSFEVSAARLDPDGLGAGVEATLFFKQPTTVYISLVIMDGIWKINDIKPAGEYPSTPEMVVQAFLIAYQENPDGMSGYLTRSRRANQPPGGSVGMLQILGSLEGVVVKSAVVNPDEPPQAVIVVLIRSGGVDSERQFVLVNEGGRWGIDRILSASE